MSSQLSIPAVVTPAMRMRESETERENRELREENQALRRALRAVG